MQICATTLEADEQDRYRKRQGIPHMHPSHRYSTCIQPRGDETN